MDGASLGGWDVDLHGECSQGFDYEICYAVEEVGYGRVFLESVVTRLLGPGFR